MRDWRVRTKLRVALTLPAVGFLVLAGVQATSSVTAATALDRFARQLSLGYVSGDLVHALQRERAHTAGLLALEAQSTQRVVVSRALTNDRAAVDQLAERLAEAVRPLLRDRRIARLYGTVASDLEALEVVRDGAGAGTMGERIAFDEYSRTIADITALLPTDFDLHADPALARTVRSVAQVARAKELSEQLRARLYAVSLAGPQPGGDYDSLANLRVRQAAALEQFRTDAGPAALARFNEIFGGRSVDAAARMELTAIDKTRGIGNGVPADEWWQVSTPQVEQLRSAEVALLDAARAAAGDLRRATWTAAARMGAIIACVLLLAMLLSWAVGRTVSRSLRVLRSEALEVANITLPAAIEQIRTSTGRPVVEVPASAVRSADEFGEVSDAFTAVHRRAVTLAVEQAAMRHNVNAMFVNLARRSQSLVERQLQLLDRLESAETDPDQLANLFKLDHLATRMRRNDDNLLVLAGSDATRRRARPVALPAVVLAAMAEIDQYARIRHDIADGLFLAGHAVSDVVHLLAELLENATMFSPPDTTVLVTGWLSPDGTGATIGIQDHGIGMTRNALDEANDIVSHPVAIDVAASERMGLLVVGHLAARQGIRVELRASTSGVLAYVTLPHRLLADNPDGPNDNATLTDSLIRRPMASLTSADLRDDGAARTVAVAHGARTTSGRSTGVASNGAASNGVAPDAGVAVAVPGVPTYQLPSRVAASGRASSTEVAEPPPARPAERSVAASPAAATPPGGVAAQGTSQLPPSGLLHRPARAEAVLDAAAGPTPAVGDGEQSSRWWSRGGSGAEPPRPAVSVAGPGTPVDAGTSMAGLPIRVPMAQLPSTPTSVAKPMEGPDPAEVGSLLTRFYSGVQRATVEEAPARPPAGTEERSR